LNSHRSLVSKIPAACGPGAQTIHKRVRPHGFLL
jgi:hypothetical protein